MYAAALMEMVEQTGQLVDLADEVSQLRQLLSAEPDLGRLVSSRVLTVDERAGVVERLFRGRVSELLYRFIQVVNLKDRSEALAGILRAFGSLMDQKRGVLEVNGQVAWTVDEPRVRRIADAIGAALGKQIVLHQHVEPDLIGGLVIRVGDRLIDGSVATRLKLIRRQLIEAGREHARSGAAIAEGIAERD